VDGTEDDVDEVGENRGFYISGGQNKNMVIGKGATISDFGGDTVHVAGPQGTLDPNLVPDVMAKLQEIVRVLEAYGEEVKQHHPGEKGFLTRLTTISEGIKASVGLVAGVGPLLDELLRLAHRGV
jgi:hypothetical protein